MTNAIERSAMRKIYLRLLPFAVLSYFLAYLLGPVTIAVTTAGWPR